MEMATSLKLKAFDLIVFDIDGTLVGESHMLQPYTINVLLELHDLGTPFTLATGKIMPATKAQADELQVKLPLILCNGAVVQAREGKILFHAALPRKVTQGVIQICDTRDENLILYLDDQILIKEMNEEIAPVYSLVKSGLYELGDWSKLGERIKNINKCMVVDPHNPQNLRDLEGLLRKEINGHADIVYSNTKLIEVLPKGVTKASAVKRLADELGISMSAVMAFGDYDNDAQLLKEAGLGICVENGSDAAKKAADLVIGSCEEQAPARFLENLINTID